MAQIPPNTLLEQENPLPMFMYALKAPESKRQYPKRLKVFLDFLTLKNELSSLDLENQCIEFMAKSHTDSKWANNKLMEFVLYQKERVYKDQIVYATIRNYLKAIKLFLDMNSDIPIVNWKRITKGLPSGKSAANYRSPTIEEIKKLVEYPDRRIKPIIYSMVSGGFRIVAWEYLKWKHITPLKREVGEILGAKIIIYARIEYGHGSEIFFDIICYNISIIFLMFLFTIVLYIIYTIFDSWLSLKVYLFLGLS